MWTVLCTSYDHAAIWAWDGLRSRGLNPVELVTAEHLAFSRGWEHRVSSDGARVKIALQDGRVLCSSRIRGVLNRLSAPSAELIAHATPADREYANCELQSFYLSWLNSLSGVVINRPSPLGLSGGWRHTSEWAIRAARAGLRAAPYRQSARDAADRGYFPLTPEGTTPASVIVLRDKVFGAVMPEAINAACIRMARAENVEMFGIDLYQDADGEWMFGCATPTPNLMIGGEPLLDYMAELFETGGRK
jgi:hypothetical protein